MPNNAQDAYLAGLAVFSIADSISYSYAGGMDQKLSADGFLRGSGGTVTPKTITMALYPKSEEDHDRLLSIFELPGTIPLIMPDGTAYAVRTADVNEVSGYYDNLTNTYDCSFLVLSNVLMSDVFGWGVSNGQYAYKTIANPLYTATSATVNESGLLIAQGGSVQERATNGVARPQPMLIAEVTPTTSGHGKVGFFENRPGATSAYFPLAGCGLLWAWGNIWAIGMGDTLHLHYPIGNNPVRLTVVVIARTQGARVEAWLGRTRVLVHNRVHWTRHASGVVPYDILAFANADVGTATLHRWTVQQT